MYEDFIGSHKTMGDVDVIYHEGIYHLFHLVLPNHDFIAHSVSEDAFTWKRVDNSIFIGHPGNWDDSMLWTMHITRDPYQPQMWRMFYTGLSRRDRQLKQRIGMASSRDLLTWKKAPTKWRATTWHHPKNREVQSVAAGFDASSPYPLEADSRFYESSVDEGRHWVSWRDPFYYHDDGKKLLLCSARINSGPLVRRGCVGLLEEVSPGQFEARPALFHPGLYDDIEVPNLIRVEGEYYLIGSIREDAKIRYWHSKALDGPWLSYHDNVLLARGNYAGRMCQDENGILCWNFFTQEDNRYTHNVMPPPKRLVRRPSGLLRATSFEGFDRRVAGLCEPSDIEPLHASGAAMHPQATTGLTWQDGRLLLENVAGFQAFVFQHHLESFRLRAQLHLLGSGKCGMVLRFDRQTHDGYYLSLDMRKGVAQLRAWGSNEHATGDKVMNFRTLQSAYWYSQNYERANVELIAFGSYLEFSVDGRVVLSLVDATYTSGAVGFYLESAQLELTDICLQELEKPTQQDDHLTLG
jgi:beta-fructofuranosidase